MTKCISSSSYQCHKTVADDPKISRLLLESGLQSVRDYMMIFKQLKLYQKALKEDKIRDIYCFKLTLQNELN